jgi:hypothetical protein
VGTGAGRPDRGPATVVTSAAPGPPARPLVADLHNHSMLSDGEGDPRTAFARMRKAGLDVAALTDHASIPRHIVGGLRAEDYPSPAGFPLVLTAPRSLDSAEWTAAGRLADAHDEPGRFTALRGFEWTEPWLGHANVWFSDQFLPVTTPGRVAGLHAWLVDEAPDALFGYNHPGREEGRFGEFHHEPRLTRRMVSLEMFNRYDDYIGTGVRQGRPSPLLACLRAGWRPGLVGVSDEHGRDYGLRGKGRAGLWAGEHSRDGVRAALLDRRVYATREPGLVLDATLDAIPMGAAAAPGEGRLRVDLHTGSGRDPGEVVAQLLTDSGDLLPAVVSETPVDPRGQTTIRWDGPEDAGWVVLRIAVRGLPDRSTGLGGHPLGQRALAYGSPWWLAGASSGVS